MTTGNLFGDLTPESADEHLTVLLAAPGVKVERIVSHGHASPEGSWYDQDWAEWVLVLQGSAEVRFEGAAAPRRLDPGDHLHIPAHTRHRVERTDAPTIWLAVHYAA